MTTINVDTSELVKMIDKRIAYLDELWTDAIRFQLPGPMRSLKESMHKLQALRKFCYMGCSIALSLEDWKEIAGEK